MTINAVDYCGEEEEEEEEERDRSVTWSTVETYFR